MSTTIPPGKNWFSSDHRSQVWSGEVSTWMGDRLGILRVVDFSFCSAVLSLGPSPPLTSKYVEGKTPVLFSDDHQSQGWLGEKTNVL